MLEESSKKYKLQASCTERFTITGSYIAPWRTCALPFQQLLDAQQHHWHVVPIRTVFQPATAVQQMAYIPPVLLLQAVVSCRFGCRSYDRFKHHPSDHRLTLRSSGVTIPTIATRPMAARVFHAKSRHTTIVLYKFFTLDAVPPFLQEVGSNGALLPVSAVLCCSGHHHPTVLRQACVNQTVCRIRSFFGERMHPAVLRLSLREVLPSSEIPSFQIS